MELNVQVRVDSLVSFVIHADSLEEGLQIARKKLDKINLYSKDVEVIDTNESITGIY